MPKGYIDPEKLERQRKRDYKTVFNSPEGKSVLADMVKFHGVFEAMTPATGMEPLELAYNEGMRIVILRILHMLEKEPTELRQELADNG